MLAAIRKFAKSWVAAILMGLLIVSFAVWGVKDAFQTQLGADEVVKAGDRVVTSADYRREFDNARKRLEAQAQQPVTAEMAAANGIDRQVLAGLATREAFGAFLAKLGLRPSDKMLLTEIQKIPAFFDPISGRFDRKTFEQRLGENGLTPEKFDEALRDEIASQHFATAVAQGLKAPRAYGAMAAIYGLENRDVSAFTVTPANVPAVAPPTDAQLQAFMRENAAQLTRPEARVLTIVRFSPQANAAAGPVPAEELKKIYDFRKDTFSKPELRSVVQIPAKSPQIAQQVIARLQRNESPDAIAKSFGVDAITYADKPKTAIADRKMADAAFSMSAGQTAQVQGDLGLAVLKIVSVTPGRTVTLEEARPMLEAEARKTMAQQKAYEQSKAYDDAHQGGADIAAAAQKAGAPALTVGPVTQQGTDLEGRPVAGVTPQIVQAAWGLPAGGESDLTEGGEGEYFAVKVERVVPPSMPPLNEIRPQLTRVWMGRETARRMEARANELAAQVRKGQSLEAVAAAAGLRVAKATDLSRQSAAQNPSLPPEFIGRAFNAKPGEVFVARGQQFAFLVGRVDAVRMQSTPQAGMIAEQARAEMSQAVLREIAQSAQDAARTKLKVKIDANRARTAIGLEPLDAQGKPDAKK